MNRYARLALMSAVAAFGTTVGKAASPIPAAIAQTDLSKPFATRSAWSFTATQEPPIPDPLGAGDEPGAIHICLRDAPSAACDPALRATLRPGEGDDLFAEPHFLNTVEVVHSRGISGRPLLLVSIASLHSGDGDQLILTQALAYRHSLDRFVSVYAHLTGKNNNQEVRYIRSGPLAGDFVSAEPTADAPYGFWISVNMLTRAEAYKEVLRYRSATTYADGNPLAVIDSEMPNILRRLGLWRAGSPLPLPAEDCPKPRLTRSELWCD